MSDGKRARAAEIQQARQEAADRRGQAMGAIREAHEIPLAMDFSVEHSSRLIYEAGDPTHVLGFATAEEVAALEAIPTDAHFVATLRLLGEE